MVRVRVRVRAQLGLESKHAPARDQVIGCSLERGLGGEVEANLARGCQPSNTGGTVHNLVEERVIMASCHVIMSSCHHVIMSSCHRVTRAARFTTWHIGVILGY